MASDHNSPKLDELPLEVIQNIASQCNARAILALCRTSRHLRAACWHPLVLRHSLERHCDLWENNSFDIESLRKSIRLDTEDWARFALADQCAFELRNGVEGGLIGDTLQRSLSWAPCLAVCQHPIVSSPWLAWSLARLVHDSTCGPLDEKAIFWYAATMMSTTEEGHDMILAPDNVVQEMFNDIHQAKHMWKVLRALGGFAVLLKQAIKENKIVRPRNFGAAPASATSAPIIYFPSATDVPILSLQNNGSLPSPFGPNVLRGDSQPLDWTTWLNQYNDHMLSPAFMTDGEWCGYYSTGNARQIAFDPPMVEIKLVTPCQHHMYRSQEAYRRRVPETFGVPPDSNWYPISGNGIDAVGKFNLLGEVRKSNKIFFTKQYATHRWVWKCTMTPFGMVGNWYYSEQDQRALGAVWLWKRSWKPFHLDPDARQISV